MRQDGGGIPFNVEEIRMGDTNFPPRVTTSDEHCSTEKAGDKGREGSAMFTLEAIAIRCTASLRTIDNHFGLRGVIPLSQPHAHCPQHALITSYLSSKVSDQCWSSRDSWVGGALPYLRAAPNCCSALTTGSCTPDLSTARVMRACSDWYVQSTLQNLA